MHIINIFTSSMHFLADSGGHPPIVLGTILQVIKTVLGL